MCLFVIILHLNFEKDQKYILPSKLKLILQQIVVNFILFIAVERLIIHLFIEIQFNTIDSQVHINYELRSFKKKL